MQVPLQVHFANVDKSDAVEARVRERVDRLERLHDRITSCRVHIEAPHKHHRKGNRYEVRIDLVIPDAELVVNNKPGDVNAHEDVYVAIRDAFDAIERQLKKRSDRLKGEVKSHEPPLQGRVAELHPEDDFGRAETVDGRLIYFHRNSVVGATLDELSLGDPVELSVHSDESSEGPQAGTVRPIRETQFVPDPAPHSGR